MSAAPAPTVDGPADLVALTGVVRTVGSVDPVAQTPSERLVRLRALSAAIDALEIAFSATVAASDTAGDGALLQRAASTAGWLRDQLRLAPGDATERVRIARGTHGGERPLAGAAAAVAGWQVTFDQLRTISAAVRHLPDDQVATAAQLLSELAPRVDAHQLRIAGRHLRHVTDPDGAGRDFERQHAMRRASLAPLLDGIHRMEVLADPEGAALLTSVLDAAMAPTAAVDRRPTPVPRLHPRPPRRGRARCPAGVRRDPAAGPRHLHRRRARRTAGLPARSTAGRHASAETHPRPDRV